ncbi:hypothetical protein EJB05_32988, partial [Eragrostis curvula]
MESRGVDRISGLIDDVLLKILSLLPSAADAVRTGALSRRWRDLWTRAPGLRLSFDVPGGKRFAEESSRTMAIIDSVLERHAGAGIDDLEISFTYKHPGGEGFGQIFIDGFHADIASRVNAWIQHGARRAAKSLVLMVALPPVLPGGAMRLELPASARAETMRLQVIRDARLSLPAEGTFHALRDLALAGVAIKDEDGRLGRLVSSPCCPRLQRLRLLRLRGAERLSVNSDTLEELTILEAVGLRRLEIVAPSLWMIDIDKCEDFRRSNIATMAIAAPKLETLACSTVCPPERLRIDSASSVLRLEKVTLITNGRPSGQDAKNNEGSISLLRQCTGVDHVGLTLQVPDSLWEEDCEEDRRRGRVRLVLKMIYKEDLLGEVPTLSNITSLEIDVRMGRHSYASTLGNFLARCECYNLEYLQINMTAVLPQLSESDYHKTPRRENKVPFPRLREVKISGISGTKDETSLLKLLLENAVDLEKMTVEFSSEDEHRGSHARQVVLDIPCVRGSWIYSDNGVCEWARTRELLEAPVKAPKLP